MVSVPAVIANTNYGVGILLNLVVFLFLKGSVSKRLGPYRYLQMTFVFFNISWTTFCWLCMARIFTTKSKFCLFLFNNYLDSLHFLCFYNAFFSLFIVIIALHFLYRYWLLYCPEYMHLFDKSRILSTFCCFAAPEFAIWYASSFFLFRASDIQREEIASSMAEEFGIDARTMTMMIGEYYRDGHYDFRSLTGLGVFTGIVVIGSAFMIFCTFRIHTCLANAKTFSASARQFHRTILIILVVQAVIPLLFIHINIGAFLIAPLFNMEINVSRDFTVLVAHFFVPLDAIAVLSLMPQYRRAIVAMIMWRDTSKSRERRELQQQFIPRSIEKPRIFTNPSTTI